MKKHLWYVPFTVVSGYCIIRTKKTAEKTTIRVPKIHVYDMVFDSCNT
jgi:hypothetical protein